MEKGKKKTKHSFDFEEFIATNGIEVKELPKDIQTMIRLIRKGEQNNKKYCTETHYKLLNQRFQRYADDIYEFLLNHFDDRLLNNTIEEEESNSESVETDTEELKQSRLILKWAAKNGRNYLLSSELEALNVDIDHDLKINHIDDLKLERELGTAKWHIELNSKEEEEKV